MTTLTCFFLISMKVTVTYLATQLCISSSNDNDAVDDDDDDEVKVHRPCKTDVFYYHLNPLMFFTV